MASFAQERNIDLVDDKVRVIVECLPDQIDAAVEAASNLGIVFTYILKSLLRLYHSPHVISNDLSLLKQIFCTKYPSFDLPR